MKTSISLLSAMLLAASGAVIAQQPGQEPGAQPPGAEQQAPGQQPGAPGAEPGAPGQQQQPGAEPGAPGAEPGAPGAEPRAEARDQEFLQRREETHIRSEELQGSAVLDSAGEEIGNVDEVLLDQDGQVIAVLVDVGGFLGIGARTVAIPWEQLQVERTMEEGVFQDEYTLRSEMTREQLEQAPEFEDERNGGTFN